MQGQRLERLQRSYLEEDGGIGWVKKDFILSVGVDGLELEQFVQTIMLVDVATIVVALIQKVEAEEV